MKMIPSSRQVGQTAAERHAQDIEMLRRLSDLGVQLAERTAHDAEGMFGTTLEAGQEGLPVARVASRRDPRLVFVQLCRTIVELMALQAKLSARQPVPVISEEIKARVAARRIEVFGPLH